MARTPTLLGIARFDAFEFDPRTGELRRDGELLQQLPEQPYRILAMLLSQPGELVAREEIRSVLWPNGTVVEFEHSINAAMNRLRQALGDSAEQPRFIETLARRGYRWKTAVAWNGVGHGQSAATLKPTTAQTTDGSLVGKRVSHYRVLQVIGGGGMGVVYQAEDLKLGRPVALKFLPDELAGNAAALSRFEREARSASALNHPNICTIYAIEEYQGQPFIVMELLDGQTLRAKIQKDGKERRPIPLDVLLALAIQIAEGLEAAHRQGILHRDIKPANIFVTNSGRAKILDFGLAKLLSEQAESLEIESLPVELGSRPGKPEESQKSDLSISLTGVAMGTAGYMSPEQLRGLKLDRRSDLFSFGLVLYEMAAGEQAFNANTAALLREAILKQEPPDPRKLQADLPQPLVAVIEKALKKDCAARFQSAGEMRHELVEISRAGRKPGRKWWWKLLGVAVALTALIGASWRYRPLASRPPLADLQFKQLTINSSDNPVMSGSISPDGSYLAYTDQQGVHLKELENGTIQTIRTPDDVEVWDLPNFAWLPGSAGFVANAHPPAETKELWNSATTAVWKFSRSGQSAQKLADDAIAWGVLEDGSVALGKKVGRLGEREMWLADSRDGAMRKILETVENAALIGPLGRSRERPEVILYLRVDDSGQNLFSLDLSSDRPVKLLDAPQMKDTRGGFAWLPDGRLLYQKGDEGSGYTSLQDTCNFWTLAVNRQSGKADSGPERLTNWTGACAGGIGTTADGRKVAFLRESTGYGTAYLADIKQDRANLANIRHFTLDDGDDAITDWTADSRTVILSYNRGDHYELYKQLVARSVPVNIAAGQGWLIEQASLSPDDKWVLLQLWPSSNPSEANEIARVPITGGTPETIMKVVELQSSFWCARRQPGFCIITDLVDGNRALEISEFDPQKGRGRFISRIRFESPLDPRVNNDSWSLSPDGARLAMMEGVGKPIQIFSLKGHPLAKIVPNRGLSITNLAWTADGKGFYASNRARDGVEIVWIDWNGNVQSVWKSPDRCFAVPSPDGRNLAIYDWKQNSNMWMMERF